MPGGHSDEPLGFIVVDDHGAKRNVPIYDQMFVGRECAGIHESRRLVIPDPEISRNHLEIRLDAVADQAFVIDTSTNGTLLNGMRLERAVPRPIRPGDEIRIADVAMTFNSQRFTAVDQAALPGVTRTRISQSAMVLVVGDIINYSTISEVTDEQVIAQSLHTLWHEVGGVLQAHKGTLNHYAGDAIFAIWEASRFADAGERAIDFALAANGLVDRELGPRLPLRGPDGLPIQMGWGVVVGTVALAAMTRSVEAVIGDSTNVAFRLAGLAGRQGRASVMVTTGVRRTVEAHFRWGEGEQVELKGRRGKETVFPVLGRHNAGSDTAPGRSSVSEPTAEMPIHKPD
jgi:adenylate cyclase